MTRVVMMTEMSWEVDEEVNRDENGEADGMNLEPIIYSITVYSSYHCFVYECDGGSGDAEGE